MPLRFSYEGRPYTPAQMKRLREAALRALENDSGFSASGITASLAIEHCIANDLPFTVSVGGAQGGYAVRLIKDPS